MALWCSALLRKRDNVRGCLQTSFKRGLDAGLLVLFLGPPFGGFGFGIIRYADYVGGVATGRITEHHALRSVFESFFLFPLSLALGALLIPAAWLGSGIAAIYTAPRIGVTGHMSLIETVILAVVCAALINRRYPLAFPSIFNWELTACALFAALTLRYLATRSLIRPSR
jgi:hypothetical protein